MITVNTTFKISPKHLGDIENEFRQLFEVVDFKVIPDTEELYEKDKTFQSLVKKVKQAQRNRDIYINNKGV